jgi:predicted transcriptional regulator
MAKLTEKQGLVLGWMQANEGAHFASDIAAGCGLEEKSVRPVLTGLAKATKERSDIYVAVSEGEKEVLDKEGKPVTRTYKMYELTDAGIAVVIE